MSSPEWKPTACILCECNCGLEVQLGGEANRHLVKLRGDDAHPASRGYACEKAHQLDRYQHGPDRITTPLRRRSDGTFEPIGWETAIAEVAGRLARVRDTHGGDTIFYYGGGGQGNHLPGAYATATRRALGSRYRSSALAQEKTGEFWVGDRMMGTVTRADFEHCEVAFFLGKNPWHSHSIPRARVTLKELSRDPHRTLIVVDPRRTETAELADLHLQVRPGTDAWLLAALVKVVLDEGRVNAAFVRERAAGLDEVKAAFEGVSVAACCDACGVGEALVRKAARVMAGAKSMASFEDLGVQMNRHSTLVSYLHHLLVALTGNLGRAGTHYVPTTLVSLFGGASSRTSPVTGARIIAGMIPCNAIADEILTEHPKRYRAMIIEAANPAHSLAESPRFREALRALDTVVVIDVAMTESAREAHYVLPASTQFEKAEATFFNFDFPKNVFHLRSRLFEPPPGPLPEAEIHARLCEALGAVTEADLAPLREAAPQGLHAYAAKLLELTMSDPRLSAQAPVLLYRTLPLPPELREGAVLLGLAVKAAMESPEALARAGFGGGDPVTAGVALFEAMLKARSGLVFAIDTWEGMLERLKPIQLALPDLLEELTAAMRSGPPKGDAAFPFVLSAGERRSFTANTIMRDAAWRKKDASGALRMSPEDAKRLGIASGDTVKLTTRAGTRDVVAEVSETMQPGHLSLPNGLGTKLEGGSIAGVAPNELTRAEDKDPWVGTPWHKHVAANVTRAAPVLTGSS